MHFCAVRQGQQLKHGIGTPCCFDKLRAQPTYGYDVAHKSMQQLSNSQVAWLRWHCSSRAKLADMTGAACVCQFRALQAVLATVVHCCSCMKAGSFRHSRSATDQQEVSGTTPVFDRGPVVSSCGATRCRALLLSAADWVDLSVSVVGRSPLPALGMCCGPHCRPYTISPCL